MKRQKILIIAFACVFVALLVSYFIFVKPLTSGDSENTDTAPETEEGESVGTANRLFMYDSMTKEDVKSIKVTNDDGGFEFERNSNGDFVITGYDSVNFDTDLFSRLINVTAYTISKTKVGSSLSDEKLDEYGFSEPLAEWTVTSLKGDSFTVEVGARLYTGGGYYCRYKERPASVYVLDNDIADTVLVPIESYVKPILCAGISKDDYYVTDKFTVYKNGEELLRIRLLEKAKQNNPDALAENILDYPTAYYPDSTLYYEIIYKYMSLLADSCYKLGATEADFAAVGLDNPAHRITMQYKNISYDLAFSEKTENNTYYVTSNLYPNVIGIVKADDYYYLEYNLIDWLDPYVFQQYITNIAKFSVTTDSVDNEFRLTHGTDEKGNATLEVAVTGGSTLSESQVANFRQYYKSLLAIAIQDYYSADEYKTLSDEEMAAYSSDAANAYMTIRYTKINGEQGTLRFYRYSTRHSLVTVDGVGEFYVLSDLVTKIENDTLRILAGETVTAFDKN